MMIYIWIIYTVWYSTYSQAHQACRYTDIGKQCIVGQSAHWRRIGVFRLLFSLTSSCMLLPAMASSSAYHLISKASHSVHRIQYMMLVHTHTHTLHLSYIRITYVSTHSCMLASHVQQCYIYSSLRWMETPSHSTTRRLRNKQSAGRWAHHKLLLRSAIGQQSKPWWVY